MSSDLTSVAIIGLQPPQARRVESLFGDKLDILCIPAATPRAKIQAATASSDYVIVMTKFTSHEAQSAVRKHDGFMYCNGAESAIKQQLDQLATSARQTSFPP